MRCAGLQRISSLISSNKLAAPAKRVDVRLCFQLLPQRVVNPDSPQHLPGNMGRVSAVSLTSQRQLRMSMCESPGNVSAPRCQKEPNLCCNLRGGLQSSTWCCKVQHDSWACGPGTLLHTKDTNAPKESTQSLKRTGLWRNSSLGNPVQARAQRTED